MKWYHWPEKSAPRRIFAIGDLHGCSLELRALLGFLASLPLGGDDLLVFLGDYVNRGFCAKGVISQIIKLRQSFAGSVVCLLGNHDRMFMKYLAARYTADTLNFVLSGGEATKRSYHALNLKAAELRAKMPPHHLQFLRGLHEGLLLEKWCFIHAGLTAASLDQQTLDEALTVRTRSAKIGAALGLTVVHGHTPVRVARIGRYELNLDTGVVWPHIDPDARWGALSCMELRSGTLFSVPAKSGRVLKLKENWLTVPADRQLVWQS